MKIGSQKDFVSGLMFSGLGIAFAWGASNYSLGTGARMGPGYFPLILGIILAFLGLCITFFAVRNQAEGGDPVGGIAWKPLACIIGSNLLFGVLLGGLPSIGLPSMGLMVGIYVLTITASLAADTFKLKEVLILATILAALSYVAFVLLLKLQFPIWPAFITG
ncbi:MAG: tripartite tricarboxylate transporter TctB family protein [Pseudomonadota bacterium]